MNKTQKKTAVASKKINAVLIGKESQKYREENKEYHKESTNFQTTFERISKEYKDKPVTTLIKAHLSAPHITEIDRQNFLEYQRLLSFGKKNKNFTESDNAIVENIVRKNLSPNGTYF